MKAFSVKKNNSVVDKNTYRKSDILKIVKNAGLSGLGEIVYNILGYATNIVITRTVGPAIFGVFSLANVVLNIAQIIASAGPGHGLLRYVAYYKGKEDFQRLKGAILFGTNTAFTMSFAIAGIVFFYSESIASDIFHNTQNAVAIKVILVALPFLTVGNIWLECLQSFQLIKHQVFIQKILQPTVKLLLVVLLFLIGMRLLGIIVAVIISALAGFLFSFHYLKKNFPIYKRSLVPVYERGEIMKFSLPVSMTQFLGVLTLYVDSLMLGYFADTTEVGIYSAAVKIAFLISMPLVAFNTIFAPMMSEYFAKNEMEEVKVLLKFVTKWIFTLSFPVFLACLLLKEPIMAIFGTGFVAGSLALVVYGAGELVNASVGPMGMLIMMTGRSDLNFINSVVFCLINVALNYLLIPLYGMLGAAVATGIAVTVINIMRLLEVYYLLHIVPFKISFLKPFAAGLISFGVMYPVVAMFSQISVSWFLGLAILYIALFGVIILLLKLEEEDRFVLGMVLARLTQIKVGILNERK